MSDHDVAARLATAAGELLLDVRAELADADAAPSGRPRGTSDPTTS